MSQRELRELERMTDLLKRIELLRTVEKKEPISFYQGVAMLFAEPLLTAHPTQHAN